ncbi:predicted protein [Naegleria gruberi]|uniref:Predicted protein n=1 Tax=Naegleria gruberi TaxID=5762 RepID=D2UX99_NAEGR|nr:uncharacterized protein NAEGRDRAFT_61688 [Naegleria gruberi]EFC50594.1 predicted protein [Naegleria gruberi]|eukprot:XP_002683338.1 predicted protein [Naegleria gruberi strain NEG-M]
MSSSHSSVYSPTSASSSSAAYYYNSTPPTTPTKSSSLGTLSRSASAGRLPGLRSFRTQVQPPSKSHQEYCMEMAKLRNVRKKSTMQLVEQMNCVVKVVQNLSNERDVFSAPPTGRRKERERLFSARSVKSMKTYFKP